MCLYPYSESFKPWIAEVSCATQRSWTGKTGRVEGMGMVRVSRGSEVMGGWGVR